MGDSFRAETRISAACAVFKIDLKGRFVYIDDETEELLGLTREELFGKSIYEYISGDSHQTLDAVMGHHKRYESFYEAVPLTICVGDGTMRRLDAVITLNFISGNPVNYQFILLPSEAGEYIPCASRERQLLEIIHGDPDTIEFNRVAEIFCSAGGYASADCYRPGDRDLLEAVGSYPHRDPGHTPPAYLEAFRRAGRDRYSFVNEDRVSQEGFGDGKSEAVICLWYRGAKNLLIRMYSAPEYYPAESQLRDLRFFSQIWNGHFQARDQIASRGDHMTIVGKVCDALNFGLIVVDVDYAVVYRNTFFSRLHRSPAKAGPDDAFTAIYESLEIRDLLTQPVPFEQSPFAQTVTRRRLVVDCLSMDGSNIPVMVLATPIEIAGTQLFAYCFIPYTAKAEDMHPLNRSATRMILTIAHDLRAPVIAIEAFAKRLQSGHLDSMDDDGRFALDCIVENVRILQQMIAGLGEISQNRIVREAPEKLYIRKIIADLITYMKATYPESEYRIRIPSGFPEIEAPRRKVTQLFRNILDNAFKYSASVEQPEIGIEYNLQNGWHQFAIHDNGPGIEQEYRQKIFAPFFRAPEAISRPGTGMGLTIAADIVSSWGGKIWLDTAKSSGTTIVFTLPPHING